MCVTCSGYRRRGARGAEATSGVSAETSAIGRVGRSRCVAAVDVVPSGTPRSAPSASTPEVGHPLLDGLQEAHDLILDEGLELGGEVLRRLRSEIGHDVRDHLVESHRPRPAPSRRGARATRGRRLVFPTLPLVTTAGPCSLRPTIGQPPGGALSVPTGDRSEAQPPDGQASSSRRRFRQTLATPDNGAAIATRSSASRRVRRHCFSRVVTLSMPTIDNGVS